MRWKVTTREERIQRQISLRCHWHKWFAWHPVKIKDDNGHTYMAWLEYVGRKDIIFTDMGDMYSRIDRVGRPLYCSINDVIIKAIKEPDIIDRRHE